MNGPAGSTEHYLEHLDWLRAWVNALMGRRRAASELDPPDPDGSAAREDPEVSR